MSPLKIIVNGSRGRMGQTIIACAASDPAVIIAGQVDEGDDLNTVIAKGDAVIDFSHHTVTTALAQVCVANKKILVIGTTGQTDAEAEEIRQAAKSIPIVYAPNFSIGVNALFWLTRKAAEILGGEFDLEVVEMHHRLKKDAPSGTAKRLAEILAEARGLTYNEHTRHGRHGIVGERAQREIGVHAIRGGDVVGDHTVIYAAQGERLELTHKAASRETFARGAIRAAQWAAGKPAGLYDMQAVLGL
jgi:4-hydroxy-tetrahydrodipicolinate reductase